MTIAGADAVDAQWFAQSLGSRVQGASFEGIHNGLLHSEAYTRLEKGDSRGTRSNPLVLDRFFWLIREFNRAIPEPARFGASAGRPRRVPDLDGTAGPTVSALAEPRDLLSVFEDSSVFTLKRVAAEQGIRKVESLRDDRVGLARWYGSFVVKCNVLAGGQEGRLQVDWGLARRGSGNEAFHEQWALSASLDQVLWEVLNRTHRLINMSGH